jgi:hypothetical protein
MTSLGRTVVNKIEFAERLPNIWFFDPERSEPLLDTVLRLAQGARLVRWTVGKDGGSITFEHQVWQEYYAARILSEMHQPEYMGLVRYATGQKKAANPYDILKPRLHKPSWRNVILMTASWLKKPRLSDFVRRILHANSLWEEHLYRDAQLAAECLIEGAQTVSDVVDEVLIKLKEARKRDIRPLTQRVDRARMDLLIAQKRSRELIALTQNIEVWWETRLEIVEAMLDMSQEDEAVEALLRMVQNQELHRKLRREAAEKLEAIGRIKTALKAWSILQKDREVGKGIHRVARQALRRLE